MILKNQILSSFCSFFIKIIIYKCKFEFNIFQIIQKCKKQLLILISYSYILKIRNNTA